MQSLWYKIHVCSPTEEHILIERHWQLKVQCPKINENTTAM